MPSLAHSPFPPAPPHPAASFNIPAVSASTLTQPSNRVIATPTPTPTGLEVGTDPSALIPEDVSNDTNSLHPKNLNLVISPHPQDAKSLPLPTSSSTPPISTTCTQPTLPGTCATTIDNPNPSQSPAPFPVTEMPSGAMGGRVLSLGLGAAPIGTVSNRPQLEGTPGVSVFTELVYQTEREIVAWLLKEKVMVSGKSRRIADLLGILPAAPSASSSSSSESSSTPYCKEIQDLHAYCEHIVGNYQALSVFIRDGHVSWADEVCRDVEKYKK